MTSTDPAAWIGSGERKADAMDPGHAARIAATLGGAAPAQGEALPPLWQWAFFISTVGMDGLGTDGHPSRGVAGVHGVRLAFAAADPGCRIRRSHAYILWWVYLLGLSLIHI